jgi:hypothetical protein
MDLGSISAAFTSLKVAGDLAKGFMSLQTTAEVQTKAIELNLKIIEAHHQIMDAQTTQTALVDEVGDLKGQIARMENWDAEKQRYELAQPFPGSMVYALKKAMSNGQVAHYLCTACFQKGQKSILQGRETRRVPGIPVPYAVYYCPIPSCKSEATTRSLDVLPPLYFEDIQLRP